MSVPALRRSAIFAGCARDCETFVAAVLANILKASREFTEVAFMFVENDSVDATVQRLREFGKDRANCRIDCFPGLAERYPLRTERLAFARNHYLDVIRRSAWRDFDYLIVFDMDDINAAPLAIENFLGAVDFLDAAPDRAGVFANQLNYYFDLYALRHAELCPDDPWEAVFDHVRTHRVPDQAAFDATYAKRMFSIDPHHGHPIEVDSAFGGLGIYRITYALQGTYAGTRQKTILESGRPRQLLWQVCEHVRFHADIRSHGGRLFIAPWLINCVFRLPRPGEGLPFGPSLYRLMVHPLND